MTELTIENLRQALERYREIEKSGKTLGIKATWIAIPLVYLLSRALLEYGIAPLCVWRGFP